MTAPARDTRGPAASIWEPWILAAGGLIALAPLVVFHRQFGQLFWFGDEFDQVDIIDRIGFWRWLWIFFGENFVPVFKLLWGFVLFAFNGSYFAMSVLLWVTHAANTVILGRVMRAAGLPWVAVWFAQIVFALTPANMETLGWPVHWSGALACTFLLLGLDRCLRSGRRPAPSPLAFNLSLLGCSAASAWCFARGVMTGPVLALACVCPGQGSRAPWRQRALAAAACLAPAVITAILIKAFASGNHQHMRGHFGEAAVFGAWYYFLNPAYRLFWVESWGWHTVVALGAVKVALIVWALSYGRGPQRLLFVLLVVFDVGNAALLGIGRYHTGVESSISSRYQYASLIGILPLAGFWVSRQLERLPSIGGLRAIATAVAILAVAFGVTRGWRESVEPFASSRGTETRRILLQDPHPAEFAVPGIPFMTTVRAKELIQKYNLH